MKRKIIPLILFFILLASLSPMAASHEIRQNNQSIEIIISTTKIPGMVSGIGIDTNVNFYLGRYNLKIPDNFEFAQLDIRAMEVFHHADKGYSPVILTVEFKGDNYSREFAEKIKEFFERYIHMNLTTEKTYHNKDYVDVIYYSPTYWKIENISAWTNTTILQFYEKIDNYSYSKIFTLNYLKKLYEKQGGNGNFGYIFSYELNKQVLWARIEFSNSTYEKYSDGKHTYDILKILNITSLPPGEIVIEGNAMQIYRHTDFYFRDLKTNADYTVENTTYYNITKAFIVHIHAKKNVTQLVLTFETKENYNWNDFMTDHGFFVVLGVLALLTAVIVIPVTLLIRRLQDKKYRE